MANKFDLASVLKNVPNLDAGREQMEYIEIDLLNADGKNFYSLDGIEDLAGNIELIGLQQPLRVRPGPGVSPGYTVISGHRRLAALQLLAEEGKTQFRSVPCIVERTEESDAMRELRLIYANSDTRRMSSADISKQAERVEALLYQLKNEGVEFPGRMRDHVAEAVKVSKSKLARLKVIRKKLIPEMKEKWEAGMIPESSAYTLAQHTKSEQYLVKDYLMGDHTYLREWEINPFVDKVVKGMTQTCAATGCACTGYQQLLDNYREGKPNSWQCAGSCCLTCYWLRTCDLTVCPNAVEKQAELRRTAAEQDEALAAELAKRKEEQRIKNAAKELRNRQSWLRAGQAAERAGVSIDTFMELIDADADDEDARAELEARLDGTAEVFDWSLCIDIFDELDDIGNLVKIADTLKCSIDWLLCRDSFAAGSAEWRTGTPPKGGLYWARFNVGDVVIEQSACWVPHLDKWTFKNGAGIEAECVCWYPLPEG